MYILSLEDADDWVGNQSLRRYQRDLIIHDWLYLKIDQDLFLVTSFKATYNHNYLRLISMQSQDELIIQSGPCHSGYSLINSTLKLPSTNSEYWPSLSDGKLVRIGHKNFAHFIWNELDALMELLEQTTPITIYQDFDSIFDVSSLPGVNGCGKKNLDHMASLRVGSRLVSRRVRSVVLDSLHYNQHKDSTADEISLLIGIRGPGRRELVNEVEFYQSLIKKVKSQYPQIMIYFDGITAQKYDPPVARIDVIDSVINQIKASVNCEPYKNLNGLEFKDWITPASHATFYITHEGSMQHKLGWLFPHLNGLILVGQKNPLAIAKWHQLQSEDAINLSTLHILPPHFFSMCELPPRATAERDRQFKITDIENASSEALLIADDYLKAKTSN
jgi:hypothetical protein